MEYTNREKRLFDVMKSLLTGTDAEEYIPHIERVVQYAKILGEREHANPQVVVPAAILHDIGRCITNDLQEHIEKGLVLCEPILMQMGYADTRDPILAAIADHHRDLGEEIPRSIEGEVLLDADRLEITGRVGIARWFKAMGPSVSIDQACKSFLGLAQQRRSDRTTFFSTVSGEAMAKEKFEFSVRFCRDLLSELSGNPSTATY